MHLIEISPAPCIHCGSGNTQNEDKKKRFIDLERDVNWNEPVILCEDCCMKIGGMVGMLSEELRKDLEEKVRLAQRESHELQAQIDTMNRRARKLGIEFTGQAA